MHIDVSADAVTFMGRKLEYEQYHYYMLNKPDGVVSATRDGRSVTVINLLKGENVRNLSPVGRLDKDTEGLLIMTDDGGLIHHLLSPSHHVEKEYEVHCRDELSSEDVKRLEEGVDIGDVKKNGSPDITLPAICRLGGKNAVGRTVLYLTIHEGRFHQVKRMLEAVGNEVLFLRRIRMGEVKLDENLKPGEYRRLTDKELLDLKGSYEKRQDS
jgi:16S rRNA pseudouridine516 synthase